MRHIYIFPFVCFFLITPAVFAWMAEFGGYRYHDDGTNVFQYIENAAGTYQHRSFLPSTGPGSFYERWCKKEYATCPNGVESQIEASRKDRESYQKAIASARTEKAKVRAQQELNKVEQLLVTLEKKKELLTELVEDYLKTQVPYHFDKEEDAPYIAVLNMWGQVFEEWVQMHEKEKSEANLKKVEEERGREELYRREERRREEDARRLAEERRREEEEKLNNTVWTCDTRCTYSHYWYSQEFGKREVTWHTSQSSTSIFCAGRGRDASAASSSARPDCENKCNYHCTKSNYGKSNFGCKLANLICTRR